MKSLAKLAVLGALTVFTAACGSKDKRAEPAPPTPLEQAKSQLEVERTDYVNRTQTRIDQMSKFSQDLKAKAATATKPQSKKVENAAEDMDTLLSDVRKELGDVTSAAPENWLDEKRDVEKLMTRAESQYNNSIPLLQ